MRERERKEGKQEKSERIHKNKHATYPHSQPTYLKEDVKKKVVLSDELLIKEKFNHVKI
jgi:hypothetical protein